MSNSHAEISNLLSEYTHRFDMGDITGAAELFKHARIQTAPDTFIDYKQLEEVWRGTVIMYEDGTPKTKHACTNAVIDVDEDNNSASSKTYYVVYQQTDTLPLQAIAAGRYYDKFERVDGEWRFCERNYSLLDHVGNMEEHVTTWEQIKAIFFKS